MNSGFKTMAEVARGAEASKLDLERRVFLGSNNTIVFDVEIGGRHCEFRDYDLDNVTTINHALNLYFDLQSKLWMSKEMAARTLALLLQHVGITLSRSAQWVAENPHDRR